MSETTPPTFGFALPDDEASRDRLAELGQLAGGLVHELKNPLGAVELNLQMLLKAGANGSLNEPKNIRRLERIATGTAHLGDIIQAFLAFARPGEPDRDRVDVNALLSNVLDEQDEVLQQADIQVVFRPEDGLYAVAADPAHLRSAFLNIILNARDALLGREDDRRLIIATRNRKEAISVVIANNGPPLSERAAAHLFDPFFSDKDGGTGLGLAIVRRLLELHYASVSAHSDPAQGVSFTIDVPTTLGPARPRTELPIPEVEASVVPDPAP